MAFELCGFLENNKLNYEVGVLPLINIEGTIKEIRENPIDGKDINDFFLDRLSESPSEEIAKNIWDIVREYEWVVDLHSAGYARYLPHVIIFEERVLEGGENEVR